MNKVRVKHLRLMTEMLNLSDYILSKINCEVEIKTRHQSSSAARYEVIVHPIVFDEGKKTIVEIQDLKFWDINTSFVNKDLVIKLLTESQGYEIKKS